jgi:hypothetical protein
MNPVRGLPLDGAVRNGGNSNVKPSQVFSNPVIHGVVASSFFMASLTPLAASPVVYMLNTQNPTAFGTADLGGLTYSSISSSLSQQLNGLASANGNLYAEGRTSATLYQINTSTGALTSVGSTSVDFVDIGSTLSGLFGLDSSGNLYSINAATGTSTLLGSTGLTIGSNYSLSNGSSTLFFANGSDSNLYTLNTATGAPTLLGFMGNGVQLGHSVGIAMSALDYVNGTLYGDENFPGSNVEYTFNTTTGAGTAVGQLSGAPSSAEGWAQIVGGSSSTPEPGTFGLLLLGFGMIPMVRPMVRKIRRKFHN